MHTVTCDQNKVDFNTEKLSSSKSTRSPATSCLSNDVSVWVAPVWGNPDRNVIAGERVDLLDDFAFPARTMTETEKLLA